MRRKKSLGILVMSALILCLLCECAKPPENKGGEAKEYSYENGHLTAVLGEKLVVDADVREPGMEQAPILHTKWKTLDMPWEEAACAVLGEDEVEYGEASAVSLPSAHTPDREKKITMLIPGWNFTYFLHAQSGKWYSSAIQEWVFDDFESGRTLYTYPEQLPGVSAENLEGFSQEEAEKMLLEKVEALNLPLADHPYCAMALNLDALETMRGHWNSVSLTDPNDTKDPLFMQPFAKEDEAWLFLWDYRYHGLPLLSGNVYTGNPENLVRRQWGERGATLFALVTRQGVEYIESSHVLYDETGADEPAELLTLEEAVALLPDYYERVLLEETRTVSRIGMYYVPVPTTIDTDDPSLNRTDLVPCWVAEASYERKGRYYWEFCYINALTGEYLPVNP